VLSRSTEVKGPKAVMVALLEPLKFFIYLVFFISFKVRHSSFLSFLSFLCFFHFFQGAGYPKSFVSLFLSGCGCYDFKQLSQLSTVVSSKVRDQTEPRRVQVLDLYCLTRFESENSNREDCLLKTS
jgi:hypothetical protein